MNSTLNTIYQHKSIRKFKQEPIPKEQYEALIKVISCVPTSINGQNFSVITIEDKLIREKIAHYAGDQEYINKAPLFLVLVADYYRSYLSHKMVHKKMRTQKSLESLLTGSVDVGIVLGQLVVAAESLGLGTVPIGSVRQQSEKVIELLELPEYTFPIVGLCVGIPDQNPDIKPRFDSDAVVFKDKYRKEDLTSKIEKYDQVLADYNKKSRNIDKNWSQSITEIYQFSYYPGLDRVVKKQGFRILSRWKSYLLNIVVQYYIKKKYGKVKEKK